jgi:hypothetical protein
MKTSYSTGGSNVAKSILDKGIDKLISRKLSVWLTATALAMIGILQSGDWVMISAIYIGAQSVIDAISKMKGNTNGSVDAG